MVCFHLESRSFSFHRRSEENPGGVHVSGLISVAVDEQEMVWVGSLGGLHKYVPGTREQASHTTYYFRNPLEPMFLGADMVGDMIFDDTGQLWLATGGGGRLNGCLKTRIIEAYRLSECHGMNCKQNSENTSQAFHHCDLSKAKIHCRAR